MIITGKKFSKPKLSRIINGDDELAQAPEKAPRKRLDLILVEKYPEYNRSTLQNFIKSGYVTVNGQVIKKPNYEVELLTMGEVAREDGLDELIGKSAVGNSIVLKVPAKSTPADVETLKIYEDDNVLVLNKPVGLLSMAKGEFTTESTLEDYGLLVHRLDRDTSGVVILAKNEATQKMLRNQFQEHRAHKAYYAVVNGRPKLDEAVIDLPLARNLKHPTTFQVDPSGKPAKTIYKVIKTDDKHSLLELKPISGRTHQLRVHLKYLGCPIVGDRVYNKESAAPRLMLHAAALEITIPGDPNQRKTFSAPLPEEFEDVF